MKRVTVNGLAAAISFLGIVGAHAGEKAGNGGNARVCFFTEATAIAVEKEQPKICPECVGNEVYRISERFLPQVKSVEAVDVFRVKNHLDKKTGKKIPLIQPLGKNETPYEYAERVVKLFRFNDTVKRLFESGMDKIESSVVEEGASFAVNDISSPQGVGRIKNCVTTTVIYHQKYLTDEVRLFIYGPLMYPENYRNIFGARADLIHSTISKGALKIHEPLLATLPPRNNLNGLVDLVGMTLQERKVTMSELFFALVKAGYYPKISAEIAAMEDRGQVRTYMDAAAVNFRIWGRVRTREEQEKLDVMKSTFFAYANAFYEMIRARDVKLMPLNQARRKSVVAWMDKNLPGIIQAKLATVVGPEVNKKVKVSLSAFVSDYDENDYDQNATIFMSRNKAEYFGITLGVSPVSSEGGTDKEAIGLAQRELKLLFESCGAGSYSRYDYSGGGNCIGGKEFAEVEKSAMESYERQRKEIIDAMDLEFKPTKEVAEKSVKSTLNEFLDSGLYWPNEGLRKEVNDFFAAGFASPPIQRVAYEAMNNILPIWARVLPLSENFPDTPKE